MTYSPEPSGPSVPPGPPLPPGWTQPPGAPYPIPQGWPSGRGRYVAGAAQPVPAGVVDPTTWPEDPKKRAQKKRELSWQPGPWRWMDLVTFLAYLGLFILGLGFFILLVPGVMDLVINMTDDPAQARADWANGIPPIEALFLLNVVNYSIMFVLVLISAWRPLIQSFKYFATWWWLKVLLLPAIWFATIVLTALVSQLVGDPTTSQNQEMIEDITSGTAFIPMFIVVGIFGPLVEEYIFRHLMIGKLSRALTLWVTAPLSVVTFAGLHFLGDPDTSLLSMFPYLVMGLGMVATYIFSKFSLAYVYLLHLLNNLIALLVTYLLPDLVDPDTLPSIRMWGNLLSGVGLG